MFQHELRVWREWRCSQCARTVRTRGNVSTRECPCIDPPVFMTLVDPPHRTDWDVSPFVTYQTEELTTPTEKELNEELPEWEGRAEMERKIEEKESRPRRGVGFLRAESADAIKADGGLLDADSGTAADMPDSEFGEGLFDEGAKARERQPEKRSRRRRRGRRDGDSDTSPQTGHDAEVAAESVGAADAATADAGESQEKAGRKRRRRRNRRSRRNSDKPESHSSVPASDQDGGRPSAERGSVEESTQDARHSVDGLADVPAADGPSMKAHTESSGESDGGGKKKRRRRRRRNKKKGAPEGSGEPGTDPQSAGDFGGQEA